MKIGLCALALSTLLLSACGGNNGSSTPGQTNPPSTTVLFETPSGAPAASIVVTLSTGIGLGKVPTGVLKTATTDSAGQATFSGLPPSDNLCVSASFSAPPVTLFKGDCFYPFPTTLTLEFQAQS
jgi:hypothetical protein